MKKQLLGLSAAAVMAATAVPASAGTLGVEGLSANLAYTTDYYFRGITQNANDPAISGGLDYAHDSGVYVGVWASSVDAATYAGSSKEVDVYFGWAGEVGGLGLDVGFLRYIYPGDNAPNDNNTNEWHIGISHDFGPVAAGLTYHRSSDFFGAGDADYVDLGIEVPINDDWSVHAHYGRTDYDKSPARGGGDSYRDASIGVATSLGPVGVDLTFTDTNGITGGCGVNSGCESKAILTFSTEF